MRFSHQNFYRSHTVDPSLHWIVGVFYSPSFMRKTRPALLNTFLRGGDEYVDLKGEVVV